MIAKFISKKFLIFALFACLAGCSVFSSKKNNNAGAFPGAEASKTNPAPDPNATAQEPPSDTGNQTTTEMPTTTPPALQCDPLAVTSPDILEATAGENLSVAIATSGACGYVDCTLADGAPSWLSINNCTLSGTPTADADLGDHPITIHVKNTRNESESADRELTLSVKDNPKINLFVAPANTDPSQLTDNVYDGGRTDYNVTLGFDVLYAKIEGHAASYDIPPLTDGRLIITPINANLYSIALANPNTVPTATISAAISSRDTHGNSVERTFNIQFFTDPCMHMEIKPIGIFKEDGAMGHYNPQQTLQEISTHNPQIPGNVTPVILGTNYRILFEVTGGRGAYVWSPPSSRIPPPANPLYPYPLNTNPNWKEKTPDDPKWDSAAPDRAKRANLTPEQRVNKVFYELKTTFSFPDNDLPYDITFSNPIYDQLTVTVTSSACATHPGGSPQASYTLNHLFQIPQESPSTLQCRQVVQDITDTEDSSGMAVLFKKTNALHPSDSEERARIEYPIHQCQGHESKCGEPRGVIGSTVGYVNEIDQIQLTFWDQGLAYCDFDCEDDGDGDRADYDLKEITCYSDYLQFFYSDTNNNIDEEVTEYSEAGGGDWHGPLKDLHLHDNSLWPASMGNVDVMVRTYTLITNPHHLWIPRFRPNYPPIDEE